MAEEEKVVQNEQNYLDTALEANKTLQEQLQATREEMAKMAEDNKTIMKRLLEGGYEESEDNEDTRTIPQIIEEMNSDKVNDLEYAELALAYRKKCMSMKKNPFDPFCPIGDRYEPTGDETEKAQNLENALKHAIEYANGDNSVFINELNRITSDVPGAALLNRRK